MISERKNIGSLSKIIYFYINVIKREKERAREYYFCIRYVRICVCAMCKVASPLGSCLFFKVSIGVKALGGCRIKGNGSQLCASGISTVECCPREYKLQVRLLA